MASFGNVSWEQTRWNFSFWGVDFKTPSVMQVMYPKAQCGKFNTILFAANNHVTDPESSIA